MSEPVRKLDASQPQKVSYCIPLWLRDEQIRANIKRVAARIEGYPEGEKRPEPCAVVCFGPSLNDTWEQVREFKYIITCSGSHKFLVDRGIVPTWHVEVDPREHKCTLLGTPHPDVEYLIASCCHPKVVEMLQGFNLKLWHVFDDAEEGQRILPPGEWAITGGINVGLRAMALARFLGFVDLHIFGMDGCEGPSGKHAAPHPNQAPQTMETEYKGVTYRTTPAFLEAARQTWHELDMLPDVTATFYGEGLVQAMAKDYRRTTVGAKANLAVAKPALISEDFRALNRQLHEDRLDYGVGGQRHVGTVLKLVESLGKSLGRQVSVLDYGCGKGYLAKGLPFPIYEYDPAVPGKDALAKAADLVICTDVLEHIEPDKLFLVLGDLRRCVKQVGYFTIHMGPAKKSYADGRNTHLIQNGHDWWKAKLAKFFTIGKVFVVGPELHVMVGPLKKKWKA
jgi:hypothetical protein